MHFLIVAHNVPDVPNAGSSYKLLVDTGPQAYLSRPFG